MKKVIAIFAIATTLVACGGKATTDSTAVAVDTTAVTATDSTTAEIVAPVATETK